MAQVSRTDGEVRTRPLVKTEKRGTDHPDPASKPLWLSSDYGCRRPHRHGTRADRRTDVPRADARC